MLPLSASAPSELLWPRPPWLSLGTHPARSWPWCAPRGSQGGWAVPGHQRWHRLLSQAGGGSLARGVCSRAGGAQGDCGGQRAGPGQNAAKGKWMKSPAGTFAAALHPSKSPAGPIQMGLPCAPCQAPGSWQSWGPGQCPLRARGAGPGQPGVTGSQPPAPQQQPGRPSPAGRRWPGPGGCRNSWLQLLGTRCPPQGPSADGRARPWGQAMGPGHRRMLLQPHGLAEMGRADRRTDRGAALPYPSVPRLVPAALPLPSEPFWAGPSYGNQGANQETARLPPGNFPWEPGPSRQGISPSPPPPRRLPR